jgi:hypothetical protein
VSSPAAVWDVIHGFSSYWALTAALDLGLFDALTPGPLGISDLSERVGAHEAGDLALLANTLVGLGLLSIDDHRYRLTPASERFLVSTSPASMAALVRLSPGPLTAWPALADTLRTGTAAHTVDDDPGAFYPDLVAATAPTQAAVAAAVAARLTELDAWPPAPVIVDFGSGSGAWTAAFLAARPEARAINVDLPEVLVADPNPGVHSIAGDYLGVELPVARADVAVLAHVLRAESPERAEALFARAVALADTVVIADYPLPDVATDESCAQARHDLLLGLTMLASTRAGRGITVAQLHAWAAQYGAELVETLTPLPRQTVFLIRSRKDAP